MYLGEELVVNGGFDTDLSNWVNADDGFVWDNGRALSSQFGVNALRQTLSVTAGTQYLVAAHITRSGLTSPTPYIYLEISASAPVVFGTEDLEVDFSEVITCDTTNGGIEFIFKKSGEPFDLVFTIDNFSVREVLADPEPGDEAICDIEGSA
jgi:hypothetical protein